MRERLIDILSNIDTPSGIKLIPAWMVPKIADALIENGVIVPTFKVGDTVWIYDFMWGVLPCEVSRAYHCHCGEKGGCTFEMDFDESDIGTFIFATKEEAEKYWYDKEGLCL